MTRVEFEDKYLHKRVEVTLFDDTVESGILYTTEDYMNETHILDMGKRYFVGECIRSHGVRFRKSHVKKIKLI
jgi:hypothetical protein